jgi:hypothetical protein
LPEYVAVPDPTGGTLVVVEPGGGVAELDRDVVGDTREVVDAARVDELELAAPGRHWE